MKKRNTQKIYYIINIIVLILSGIVLFTRMGIFRQIDFRNVKNWILGSVIFLVGFFLIHLFKMIRYYLILLEEKIDFVRFMKVYFKITFVNVALPLKSGEIFRVYCFSRETNNIKTGIFSVLIDRVFDTWALLVILIPYDLIIRGKVTMVTAFLLIFVAITMVVYKIFMPTYYYLNHFLITNTKTKKSIVFLRILENMRTWYDYISKLLLGRSALVFAVSCIGWIAEFVVLSVMVSMINFEFGFSGFVAYIESIFGIGSNNVLNVYTTITCVILLTLTLIIYAVSYARKGRK